MASADPNRRSLRQVVGRIGSWPAPAQRALGLVVALSLITGVFAAGWFVGLYVDTDDQQVADANAELANANGQIDGLEDELANAEDRAALLEQERDTLKGQIRQLTGEEGGSAGLGLEGVKVVSKGKTLKLEEMQATLTGYTLSDTVSDEFETRRADGQFLTASVAIMNRLDAPQMLDPEEHFTLVIDGQEFTPDFDAMNYAGGDNSWLNVGLDDLQPGTTKTGTVTFDISREAASKASKGVLLSVQFSDAGGFGDESPSLPVAGLKLE